LPLGIVEDRIDEEHGIHVKATLEPLQIGHHGLDVPSTKLRALQIRVGAVAAMVRTSAFALETDDSGLVPVEATRTGSKRTDGRH
jgi:hypothetical protein